MAQAKITVNATPGSDDDVTINTLVQLDNVNNGGELTYAWTILDQPVGTANNLSSSTTQNPTFTPKKEGTYFIELIVNKFLANESRDTVIVGIRQVKSPDVRIPAAGETIQADTAKGWAPVVDNALLHSLSAFTDGNVLVGTAGVGGLVRGNLLKATGATTLKATLPGEESVPSFTKALGTKPADLAGPIYILESGVDGSTTPANGALIRVRKAGQYSGASGAGAVAGNQVYISDTGTLSLTAGTNARPVGRVTGPHASTFDMAFDGGMSGRSDIPVFNVLDYGAKADPAFVADDSAGIQAAIDAAVANGGGIVYFPEGTYPIRNTLYVPRQISFNIELRGAHIRNTRIIVDAAIATGLHWGDTVRDVYVPPSTLPSDHNTLYGRVSNLTISANAIAAGTTLMHCVEAQLFEMHSVNLEEATTGIGLFLQGSDTSAAGKNGAATPHLWRCKFIHVGVYHCRQPLLMDNCDENDFYGCNFDVDKVAVVSGRVAIRITQGRNNRFYGTLCQGSAPPPAASIGVLLDGLTTGPVEHNQFYGLVSEGWTTGWVVNDKSVVGTTFNSYNSSLNTNAFSQSFGPGSNGTFNNSFNDNTFFTRLPANPLVSQPIDLSNEIILDMRGGNYFYTSITTNTPWTLKNPLMAGVKEGQPVILQWANASGGVIPTPTIEANWVTAGAITMPANGFRRLISFTWDGSKMVEMWRSTADLAV